jgi:hypothetical protein
LAAKGGVVRIREMHMRTPVTQSDSYSIDTAPSNCSRGESSEGERPFAGGRLLIGVFLVSIALWFGSVIAIRTLIAAL